MDNKDQLKGKVEEAVGDLTDDKDLQRRGQADQKAGRVKEVLQTAKDKADLLVDSVKDKITHH